MHHPSMFYPMFATLIVKGTPIYLTGAVATGSIVALGNMGNCFMDIFFHSKTENFSLPVALAKLTGESVTSSLKGSAYGAIWPVFIPWAVYKKTMLPEVQVRDIQTDLTYNLNGYSPHFVLFSSIRFKKI